MHNSILDEGFELEKTPLRTTWIHRVEQAALGGSAIVVGLVLWNMINDFSGFNPLFSGPFLLLLSASIGSVAFWKNITINYDQQASAAPIHWPTLLKASRIGLFITALWLMFSSVNTLLVFYFFPAFSLADIPMTAMLNITLIAILNGLLGGIYGYYWYKTHQIMRRSISES